MKKSRWSSPAFRWTLYDWANSVFPLVITSAIFPNYYEYVTSHDKQGNAISDILTIGSFSLSNQTLYSYTYSLGLLLVVIFLPLLSGIADYYSKKKFFLYIFCLLGAVSTFLLYFLDRDNIVLTMIPFVTATFGFWGSVLFYNSFLPLIAPPEEQDKLSARGFSMGYLGSSLLLIFCIIGILFFKYNPETHTGFFRVPYAFVLTSVWWVVFGFYAIGGFPEKKQDTSSLKGGIWNGFRELYHAWKEVRKSRRIGKFLTSFFFYNTGVQTIMVMAVLFARKEIEWPDEQSKTGSLIVSVLLIQFLGIAGAWLFSRISGWKGNIFTLRISVVLWMGVCIYAYAWARTPSDFYLLAAMVGLMMGGIQALSRSTFSKMLPPTASTASLFSFYDITEKIGIITGTFLFGFISEISGGMRNAVLLLITLFVMGFLMLLRIRNQRE